MLRKNCHTFGYAIALLAPLLASELRAAEPQRVDFNQDVRPILSETCFRCHGPDSAAREAELRLDHADDAFADRGDYFAIVPGKPQQSEAYRRLVSDDETERMPPPDSHLKLTAQQIEIIRRWIEQGANYEKHWSFIPPKRPELPPVNQQYWPRNGIDHFILAKLEQRGLKPTARANKETLIRRLSFDLTGLPPTPEEIDAFLADESDSAYEKVVDRLLASPAYGERMALQWLDGARYADTNGYQNDAERYMWRWRDWVIAAFNANMPFDQFTTEQLAGDLLPDATLDQKIATGFNRNHTTSDEGGIIPEEYRVDYVANRVETMSTVWLGLTVNCARCHSHKYDPITQREYYQLFSFFNNIPEKGKDGDKGNSVPFIKAPTPQQAAKLKWLDAELEKANLQVDRLVQQTDSARAEWELAVSAKWDQALAAQTETKTQEPIAHFPFDAVSGNDKLQRIVPAHVTPGLLLTGETPLNLGDVADFDTADRFSISFWVRPSSTGHGAVISRGDEKRGYEISLNENRSVEVRLLHDGEENSVYVYARGDLPAEQWTHVVVTYDGSGKAAGLQVYKNGHAAQMRVRKDTLNGGIASSAPLSLGAGKADGPRFRGLVDDLRIFEKTIDPQAVGELCAARGARWQSLEVVSAASDGKATFTQQDDGSLVVSGSNPPRDDYTVTLTTEQSNIAALRLEALADPSLPKSGPGRRADGLFYLSEVEAEAISAVDSTKRRQITFTAAYTNGQRNGFEEAKLIDGVVDGNNAWSADRQATTPNTAILVAAEPFGYPGGTVLKVRLRHRSDFPSGTLGRFRVSINSDSTVVPRLPEQVAVDLAATAEQRSDAAKQRLAHHYIRTHLKAGLQQIDRLQQLNQQQSELKAAVPTTMVMQEMPEPRKAFLLVRGQYNQHGEEVQPGVPAALTTFPEDAPANRLGLARWLTSADHPLTARVTMNRYWKMYFGTGLVKTDEDFGAQGEWPLHVDLLDWLATEFVRSGWDVKAMQKFIVMSAAYQQDSRVSPELLKRDPQNRLLGRGPRFRLSAEMIRDNALTASGLLVRTIGGPSVKPYQPPGLWKEVSSGVVKANLFEQDHGEKLYRRSLYTFWKRAAPPPAMQTFDAPTREYCVTNRSRTNTPLQALVLMNDVTYIEAARVLAQRIMQECPADAGERLTRAFRLVLGRTPTWQEHVVLLKTLKSRLAYYRTNSEAAAQLLSVGEAPREENLDTAELAAWANVCSMILCLDEAITKG